MTTRSDTAESTEAEVLDRFNSRLGALAETMGIRFTAFEPERLVATMPVEGNTQPFGLLHGGANAVLAETVGSVAAGVHAAPDRIPVGIELNCSHHKAANGGLVTAVCAPLSLGRSLTSHQISITDDSGRLLCTARLTCMLRDAPD